MALELIDSILFNFECDDHEEEISNFFDELPCDITQYITLSYLHYRDQTNFVSCSKSLYSNYAYYLYRYYCCTNCDSPLFHPKCIEFSKYNKLNQHHIENQTETQEIGKEMNIETEDGNAVILYQYKTASELLSTSSTLNICKTPRKLISNIEIISDKKYSCSDRSICNGISDELTSNDWRQLMSIRALSMLYNQDILQEIQAKRKQFIVNSVLCKTCKLFLGFKIVDVINLGKDNILSNNFKNNVLNRVIICKNYIRLLSLDVNINNLINNKRISIYCTGIRGKLNVFNSRKLKYCGNLLTFKDEILSNQHCWSIDGNFETANYYNSMYVNGVYCRDIKMKFCAQGAMMISKVFCSKCDGEIGWRFELNQTELDEPQIHCNENQYGRYGLVNSSITYYPNKQTLIESDDDDEEDSLNKQRVYRYTYSDSDGSADNNNNDNDDQYIDEEQVEEDGDNDVMVSSVVFGAGREIIGVEEEEEDVN